MLKAMYNVNQHSKHGNICNKIETLVHNTAGKKASENLLNNMIWASL